jgi:hypothetical protein
MHSHRRNNGFAQQASWTPAVRLLSSGLRLAFLVLTLDACAPPSATDRRDSGERLQPFVRGRVPPDWVAVAYVDGIAVRVPTAARVQRPQGIDSDLLIISGRGYRINFDDFGSFAEPADGLLDGHRAQLRERSAGQCIERSLAIELPRAGNILACGRGGATCRRLSGVAKMGGRCLASGCDTMSMIMNSVSIGTAGSNPQPGSEPFDEPPLPCRMPGD